MDSYRGTMLAVYAVAISGFIGFPQVVFAQTAIAPDHTLPVNTLVNFNSTNKTYTITGGTQVGTNQFHSFQDFSVPTANTAHFDNALTTTNVIGRVTGANISDIDGTLRTNGTANLYLINPNGVIFGNNAKLDVAGSFSASTANSLKFSDGSEFSATNPQAPPLLQVNVPLGLQYGKSNPAAVSNAGNLTVGGDLTLSGGAVTSVGTLNAQGNLRVDAVASNVSLSQFQAGSAMLTANQGIQLENGKFQTTGDLRLLAKDFVLIQDSAAKPLNLNVGGDLLVQGDRAVTVNTLAHPDSSLWVGKNVLLRSANPIAIDAHWNAGGNLRVEKLNGFLGDLFSPLDPVFQFSGDVSFGNYTGASLQILAGGSVTATGTIFINAGAGTDFNNSTVILSDGSPLSIDGSTPFAVDIRAGVTEFFPSPTPISASSLSTANPTSADISIGSIIFADTNTGANGLVFLTNQFAPPLDNALDGNISVGIISTDNALGNAGSAIIDSKGSINLTGVLNTFSTVKDSNAGNVWLIANGNINVAGINAHSQYSNAGNVFLWSYNGSIDVNSLIDASTWTIDSRNGGNVDLKAYGSITTNGVSTDGGNDGTSGNVFLRSDIGSIDVKGAINTFSTANTSNAGDVRLIANGNINVAGIDAHSKSSNAGSVSLWSYNGSIDVNSLINASTSTADSHNGGNVDLEAYGNITTNGIRTDGGNDGTSGNVFLRSDIGSIDVKGTINSSNYATNTNGDAGYIWINAPSITFANGSVLSSSTFGTGNAGYIRIDATNKVSFDNSKVSSDVKTGAVGDAGYILVNAPSITFANGSVLSSSTFGTGHAGYISVDATDLVSFDNSKVFTQVEPKAISLGSYVGFIYINAPTVTFTGSLLSSDTYGTGDAGYILINGAESVSFFNSKVFSNVRSGAKGNAGAILINSYTLDSFGNFQPYTSDIQEQFVSINKSIIYSDVNTGAVGDAGYVWIKANNSISIADNSWISSDVLGRGNGKYIWLDAAQISLTQNSQVTSKVFPDAIGDAGYIQIDAQTLKVLSGSKIATDTASTGNAGNIEINLTQSLILDGDGSKITASTSKTSTGKGGSIIIDPPLVSITNHAGISVNSQGTGDGGDLKITADKFVLSDNAFLSANTANGKGGNISLILSNVFFPRRNSYISATAGNNGNGGNITISNPFSFLVSIPSENNDIHADANLGDGGSIKIAAQYIFGFKYSRKETPLSDITASSEFGLQGTVDLNTPNVDLSIGLNNLPADTRDLSRLVIERCIADRLGSSFTITGRGGIAAKPSDRPTDTGVLDNFGTISPQTTNITTNPNPSTTPDRIIEATGLMRNAQNQIVLIAGETPSQAKIACP